MTKIIDFFKNMDKKSLRVFKHIGYSSIFRAGSILIGLMLIPLSIRYLGSVKFGLWLTLFSFLGWFNIVDFGLGNGLRNKLSHALAHDDTSLAKNYVSTAYISIGFISLFTFLLFMIIYPFVDWHIIFNFDADSQSTKNLIFVAFLMFTISLTLKNINVIYYADQRSSLPELFNFAGQSLSLILVYIAMIASTESLFIYGVIILGSQILILLVSTLISFFGRYKNIRPSIKHFHLKYIKDILSIGGKFFIIQISYILLATTDNFIINYVLGSADVTVYNIPYKYFMLAITIITIISTPYWSAFTDAFSRNDYLWMEKSMKMLFKISIGASAITVLMILVSNRVYSLWLGGLVDVPFTLTLIMGLSTIVKIFIYPVVMFLNGVGKVQIELYLGLILAATNIFLSIFLARNMGLGVSGVILATLLVGLVELMILPLQVRKIIQKKAKGIWNK